MSPAYYPTAELDPVAVARLDDLGLTFATDAELAAATAALQAADALKQDAATAATDAELAAARAAVEAAMATDAELAGAVAALQAADALKQDAATAATDAELAALPRRRRKGRVAGRVYMPQCTTSGTGNFSAIGRAYFAPFWTFSPGFAFDRIYTSVTTALAGGLWRLGVYADNGAGLPGALLADYGTVGADTVGDKFVSVAGVLPDAELYWLVVVQQGAAGNIGTNRMQVIDPNNANTSLTPVTSTIADGVNGALPDPAPAVTGTFTNAMPYIGLRAS